MSAFLVSDATITKILDGFHMRGSPIWDEGRMHTATPAQFDQLGRDLLIMNHHALNARYGDEMPESVEYTYPMRFGTTTRIQVYKAIQCFLYQCSEGDVPESLLFERVGQWSRDVASAIIYDLPEYERTPWDFPDNVEPERIALSDLMPRGNA